MVKISSGPTIELGLVMARFFGYHMVYTEEGICAELDCLPPYYYAITFRFDCWYDC